MAHKKRKKKLSQRAKSQEQVKENKIRIKILGLLEGDSSRVFTLKQIIKRIQARDKISKHIAERMLDRLVNQNKIIEVKNGFKCAREPDFVTGKVDYVNPKFCYVSTSEMEEDVWVPTDRMHFAFDGDEVKVMLFTQLRKGRRLEGRITQIIKRGRNSFVGRIEQTPNYSFVIPDHRKMHQDIFVKPENTKNSAHNDKVIIEITQWPEHDKNPEGIVTEILGKAGENNAEIHSIMAEFGLPFRFPVNINKAAERIQNKISDSEIKKRRDFRGITTLTIDPEDAKDFDDALSLQILDNGNFEIGIHIADVSHYVKPGSILDQEAYDRATSVYLVDRTIPMLPERLSNELCSLNPKEDKLTFSAVFELDSNGHVIKEWFGRTIIHSDKRFSYEEAQKTIEQVSGPFSKELTILNEMALKLRVDRFMRGSINFETTEVKFDLDTDGKPLGIIPKVRKDAHKLVEEFMLLANKRVAEFVFKMKQGKSRNTFIYRTHNFPDPDKINAFSVFAKKFGHNLHTEQAALATSLNTLIEDIDGRPEQNVLQTLAIRSMAKAIYTTKASMHFGLAFPHYTHFTSPIRRYPDVMVHRLLQHYLDKGQSVSPVEYEEQSKHSSEREKRAADAERASIKYKQVEYIESVSSQEFDGIVAGVTEYGIFVEMIENKCEGMVRISTMKDDYYEFDEDNYCIIGRRNKRKITLGDSVRVKVTGTDIDRRTIDLSLIETDSNTWR